MRQDLALNGRAKFESQRIDALLNRIIEIQRIELNLFGWRGLSGFYYVALRGGVILHNNLEPEKMSAKSSTGKRVKMWLRSAATTP